jgi:hypothetical protein
MSHSHDLPPELLDAARALEQHRPQLTEPQLARVKRRVTGDAPTLTTRPAGGFMKSRLAITAMLATGVLMSGGGAALGVSALTTDLNASSAQYGNQGANTGNNNGGNGANSGTNAGNGGNSGTNAGAGSGNAGTGSQGGNAGTNDVLGAGQSGPGGSAGDVAGARETTAAAQAPRQLSASQADRLPFTGYAAIPLLLVGLALLVAGLVLRRSTRGAPLGA